MEITVTINDTQNPLLVQTVRITDAAGTVVAGWASGGVHDGALTAARKFLHSRPEYQLVDVVYQINGQPAAYVEGA